MDKMAPAAVSIHELLARRWSPRAFASRPVEPSVLQRLVEAFRWAPSCYNEQPWRLIVTRAEEAETFGRMLACLTESNRRWARHAPVLMLSVAQLQFSANAKPNRLALHDAGLALAALIFQATSLGLAVHPMAGFHGQAARAAWCIPADAEPAAALAVGYPGDPAQLPDDLRERELAPRRRHPAARFVFGPRWGVHASWLAPSQGDTETPSP
jgi:nitroreductase